MSELTSQNLEMVLGRVLLAELSANAAVVKLCVYVGQQANDASVGEALLSDVKETILNGIDGAAVTTNLSVENIRNAARQGYGRGLARVTIGSSQ